MSPTRVACGVTEIFSVPFRLAKQNLSLFLCASEFTLLLPRLALEQIHVAPAQVLQLDPATGCRDRKDCGAVRDGPGGPRPGSCKQDALLASDATLMALAGHMSRQMMEHYSHVRMAAKRSAVDCLATGLISAGEAVGESSTRLVN